MSFDDSFRTSSINLSAATERTWQLRSMNDFLHRNHVSFEVFQVMTFCVSAKIGKGQGTAENMVRYALYKKWEPQGQSVEFCMPLGKSYVTISPLGIKHSHQGIQ